MADILISLIATATTLFLLSSPAMAVDSLTPPQNLFNGATLVSAQSFFELGFFRPQKSTGFYLGIWYKRIPIRTVVWVANRETPINHSSAVLKISSTANAIALTQNDVVIWSSTPMKAAENRSPKLQLLDDGNLVLKDAISGVISWQSFDCPTDTLLPGMKLGRDFTTGINRRLSAWKNPSDPSPGSLTMEITNTAYPEPVMWNGSKELMRSGPWNGLQFSAKPTSALQFLVYHYNKSKSELSFSYTLTPPSLIGRMVMNQTTSKREILLWSESARNWMSVIGFPWDLCDEYGLCGAFGSCDDAEGTLACKCLNGYRPRNLEKWNLKDYAEGCVRNRAMSCSDEIGFEKYPEVKLPDTKRTWVDESMGLSECREECARNCSCVAYANTDVRGSGSGCAIWVGELIDIRVVRGGGQDLYVRMLASELQTKRKTGSVVVKVIVGTVVLVVAGLALVGSFYVICRRRRSSEGHDEDLELPLFDLTTISSATDNFSNSNKLGEGGFGAVFRGRLVDGQEIAVKRLSSHSRQGTKEFKNEVILIAKLQHRNLVKLLGCCIQGEEKLLIYEYMPNKSLDSFIFDSTRKKLLDWSKRFNIICGIARGILYLHQDSRLRIIHRDLKASNVLLDIDMNPKISDFGMARTFGGDQIEGNTGRVVGTFGYMAPEYAMGGQFSIKSDAFSFGILLLEIISGEKNRGFSRPNHALNLIGHAWKLWKEGEPLELIDATIGDSYAPSEVLRCIHVSLLCLQQHPEDRPTMSNVVLMLSSESALAQPKQPGFYMERDSLGPDSVSDKNESSTTNELTITLMEAR